MCFISRGGGIIFQLRTGYVGAMGLSAVGIVVFPDHTHYYFNEYLHKCNIKDTDLCKCGAKETVSHYLIECNMFDTTNDFMIKWFFEIIWT